MKIKIKHKLLLLIALPTIALLIFSLNHFNDKYSELQKHKIFLIYSKIIKNSSNLLHQLQLERGLSSNYINNTEDAHLKITLKKYHKNTDNAIKIFKENMGKIDTTILSNSNKNFLYNIDRYIIYLKTARKQILKREISSKESFKYYTDFTVDLLELTQSFETHSNNNETYNDTLILKKLLLLQEFAGQERGFMAHLLNAQHISREDMYRYNTLITIQDEHYKAINKLLQNSKTKNILKNIHKKYKHSYIDKSRKAIENYEKQKNLFVKKIFNSTDYTLSKTERLKAYKSIEKNLKDVDAKKLFDVSTQKIDDLHMIEKKIMKNIDIATQKDLKDLRDSLLLQISLTLSTILSLLLGATYLARGITNSVKTLQIGVKNFFDFLNFKKETPNYIQINSNDEIYDIAQDINAAILFIEKNLEQDKNFINEATHIVMLMRDGDFTEKLYFEPNNPNLKDLKKVLDELISLITSKIKQQTESLEELNSSLENKVYHQTIELHNQVKELTIARDEAIQAEVAKDDFLANMSHEIRTPLNAILGFVTILKKRIEDKKSLHYLDVIDSSGMSLLTIINDILDFSKIQSGKFSIFPYDINPLEEFSNTALLFASKVYEKHLLYDVYIDPKLPHTISVDAVRVKQIIANLLSNAIKFTPEDGQVKLKVYSQKNNLIISVEDTGIGISKENLSKVFSAFEQADGTTTRKYGGTGLGLSISSKLASLMDGAITLESQEGKGSTFTLTVPIDVIDAQTVELIDKEKIANIRFGLLNNSLEYADNISLIKQYLQDFGAIHIEEINEHKEDAFDILFFVPDDDYNEDIVNLSTHSIALLRSASVKLGYFEHIQPLYAPFIPKSIVTAIDDTNIQWVKSIEPPSIEMEYHKEEEVQYSGSILVAEDNKTNQMLIGLMLDDYGLEYTIVNNGVEAVKKFKEERFDLVLMDENMPELNGIGAMKQIKEYEKQSNVTITPIIALTACVLDSDKKMFLDAGMDGFVAKPINNEILEAEFNKYLQRK